MKSDKLTELQLLDAQKGHRRGPYMSFNPVSSTQIWQWCSAMGDHNPGYLPGDQQLAPPAMMQMWTMRNIDDQYAPGSTTVAPYGVFDEMRLMGYPANVAVSYDINFSRYLRPGERPRHYTTVVSISDKKTTGLGIGFFVTERVEYFTLDEKLFAEASITYFQYQPAEQKSADDTATETPMKTQWPPNPGHRNRQPDFVDIDVATISPGRKLPVLYIPITHKLIVGGALASQDFIPVHHNLPAAKAAGMPDIFMNILTTSGLLARYLSDWAGTGSRLQQIIFSLLAPNLPGDTMVMEGEVTAVERQQSGAEVHVSLAGKNRLGCHARGEAILILPGTAATH